MLHASHAKVLVINASARHEASNTRALSREILDKLENRFNELSIIERDVAKGLPLIDEQWVAANHTQADQRSLEQQQALALSDELIAELQAADIVIIGAPMYNFSIPASLKAWVDLVARAGVTFRYTDKGPLGLLQDKQAYVVVTTGGARIGSEVDFASGYLEHVLGFIGIEDVRLIEAERYDAANEEHYAQMRARINQVVEEGIREVA